ncbi:uncharacterized protein LOC114674399 [Macaca mulatta]
MVLSLLLPAWAGPWSRVLLSPGGSRQIPPSMAATGLMAFSVIFARHMAWPPWPQSRCVATSTPRAARSPPDTQRRACSRGLGSLGDRGRHGQGWWPPPHAAKAFGSTSVPSPRPPLRDAARPARACRKVSLDGRQDAPVSHKGAPPRCRPPRPPHPWGENSPGFPVVGFVTLKAEAADWELNPRGHRSAHWKPSSCCCSQQFFSL